MCCKRSGPVSPPHPPRPDAFDVHARKGFRKTTFFFLPSLPPFSFASSLRLVSFLTRQAVSAPMRCDGNCRSQMRKPSLKPHWQKSAFNWRDGRKRVSRKHARHLVHSSGVFLYFNLSLNKTRWKKKKSSRASNLVSCNFRLISKVYVLFRKETDFLSSVNRLEELTRK